MRYTLLFLLFMSLLYSGCTATSKTTQQPEVTYYANLTNTETTSDIFAPVSPKAPWGEFDLVQEEESSGLRTTLLWLPNRMLDFIDIFRVDVGAGLATGAVVRLTSYVQAGARFQSPGMLRVGGFGRESPVKLETETELGIGPFFKESKERNLCKGIVAAGLDLFFVGLHVGLCPEELTDFVLGVFTVDIMEDDLK